MADIDTALAAELLQISQRHCRRKSSNFITKEKVGSAGQGGISYTIELSSLPEAAQRRYLRLMDDRDNSGFDMASLQIKKGKEGVRMTERKLEAVRSYRALMQERPPELTKRTEELAKEYGISQGTLRSWAKKYADGGMRELAPNIKRKDKGAPRNICKRAQAMIKDMAYRSNRPTNRTIYYCLLELEGKLGEKACENCPFRRGSERRAELIAEGCMDTSDFCDKAQAGLIIPQSCTTIDRYIDSLPRDISSFARWGKKAWEADYMPKVRREKPGKVNEVWFGDHHQMDIFVRTSEGKVVRPWLTAWMDARSGCMIGTMLSLNPNTDTIIEAFERGVQHKEGNPFYGIPKMLYTDNGRDYRSKRMERGCERAELGKINTEMSEENGLLSTLGVGVIHALPYQGWSKTIERAFGTLERCFIQGRLPGWCGNSAIARPEKLESEIKNGRILSFEEFAEVFYREILPAYHNFKGSQGKSPMEIYMESEKYSENVPSYEIFASFKKIREPRKIGTTGIRMKGKTYMDDALIPHIGKQALIAYNRDEDESISVYLDGEYYCEAAEIEKFKLVGEDEKKVAEHVARQKGRKKEIRQIIRDNREIASIGRDCAYETLSKRKRANIYSMRLLKEEGARLHEKDRLAFKKQAQAAGANAKLVEKTLMEKGRQLLEQLKQG